MGVAVGGAVGGLAGLAALSAAGVGAGYAVWKFIQRQGASPQAASALEGTEASAMNENALFQMPADGHANELFQSASAISPVEAAV